MRRSRPGQGRTPGRAFFRRTGGIALGPTYTTELPSAEAFFHLFRTTGWHERHRLTAADLASALPRSWYAVSCYDGDRLVGFGRLLSDGAYQCFVCDMIVLPQYQRRGIGSEVLRRLLEHCRSAGIGWVQLTAAQGRSGFYERFGFRARPDDAPGMQLFLRQEHEADH